jgi:hypothetical protein
MAFEWQMVSEHVDDPELIVGWLEKQFEPFAVANDKVWLRRMVNVERDDKATDYGQPSDGLVMDTTKEVEVADADN